MSWGDLFDRAAEHEATLDRVRETLSRRREPDDGDYGRDLSDGDGSGDRAAGDGDESGDRASGSGDDETAAGASGGEGP